MTSINSLTDKWGDPKCIPQDHSSFVYKQPNQNEKFFKSNTKSPGSTQKLCKRRIIFSNQTISRTVVYVPDDFTEYPFEIKQLSTEIKNSGTEAGGILDKKINYYKELLQYFSTATCDHDVGLRFCPKQYCSLMISQLKNIWNPNNKIEDIIDRIVFTDASNQVSPQYDYDANTLRAPELSDPERIAWLVPGEKARHIFITDAPEVLMRPVCMAHYDACQFFAKAGYKLAEPRDYHGVRHDIDVDERLVDFFENVKLDSLGEPLAHIINNHEFFKNSGVPLSRDDEYDFDGRFGSYNGDVANEENTDVRSNSPELVSDKPDTSHVQTEDIFSDCKSGVFLPRKYYDDFKYRKVILNGEVYNEREVFEKQQLHAFLKSMSAGPVAPFKPVRPSKNDSRNTDVIKNDDVNFVSGNTGPSAHCLMNNSSNPREFIVNTSSSSDDLPQTNYYSEGTPYEECHYDKGDDLGDSIYADKCRDIYCECKEKKPIDDFQYSDFRNCENLNEYSDQNSGSYTKNGDPDLRSICCCNNKERVLFSGDISKNTGTEVISVDLLKNIHEDLCTANYIKNNRKEESCVDLLKSIHDDLCSGDYIENIHNDECAAKKSKNVGNDLYNAKNVRKDFHNLNDVEKDSYLIDYLKKDLVKYTFTGNKPRDYYFPKYFMNVEEDSYPIDKSNCAGKDSYTASNSKNVKKDFYTAITSKNVEKDFYSAVISKNVEKNSYPANNLKNVEKDSYPTNNSKNVEKDSYPANKSNYAGKEIYPPINSNSAAKDIYSPTKSNYTANDINPPTKSKYAGLQIFPTLENYSGKGFFPTKDSKYEGKTSCTTKYSKYEGKTCCPTEYLKHVARRSIPAKNIIFAGQICYPIITSDYTTMIDYPAYNSNYAGKDSYSGNYPRSTGADLYYAYYLKNTDTDQYYAHYSNNTDTDQYYAHYSENTDTDLKNTPYSNNTDTDLYNTQYPKNVKAIRRSNTVEEQAYEGVTDCYGNFSSKQKRSVFGRSRTYQDLNNFHAESICANKSPDNEPSNGSQNGVPFQTYYKLVTSKTPSRDINSSRVNSHQSWQRNNFDNRFPQTEDPYENDLLPKCVPYTPVELLNFNETDNNQQTLFQQQANKDYNSFNYDASNGTYNIVCTQQGNGPEIYLSTTRCRSIPDSRINKLKVINEGQFNGTENEVFAAEKNDRSYQDVNIQGEYDDACFINAEQSSFTRETGEYDGYIERDGDSSTGYLNKKGRLNNYSENDEKLHLYSYQKNANKTSTPVKNQPFKRYTVKSTSYDALSKKSVDRYSRKVFVGGLPQDITEEQLYKIFGEHGELIVDWPYKSNSLADQLPKGYVFLLYRDPGSVSKLLQDCLNTNGKSYATVSSDRSEAKQVQIRTWTFTDAHYENISLKLEHPDESWREFTIFLGGIPRQTTAKEVAMAIENNFGLVVEAHIDVDSEYKYPKGAASIQFLKKDAFFASLRDRYVTMKLGGTEKKLEIKPYYSDDKKCTHSELKGEEERIRMSGSPSIYFCASYNCLKFFCSECWTHHFESHGGCVHFFLHSVNNSKVYNRRYDDYSLRTEQNVIRPPWDNGNHDRRGQFYRATSWSYDINQDSK